MGRDVRISARKGDSPGRWTREAAVRQHSYSWDEYVEAQIKANLRKENVVWVRKRNIDFLSAYIGHADVIVCHGTRNGREQEFFKENFPDAEIIGTEISPSARKYPMTVQHDFHEPLEIHSDATYTNSLDHAYYPDTTIWTWLRETNLLLIEHSDCDFDDKVTEHDPFGASFEEIQGLIERNGGTVIDMIDCPEKHPGAKEQKVFVCRMREKGR